MSFHALIRRVYALLFVALLSVALGLPGRALAHVTGMIPMECPLCGQKFKGLADLSGTSAGLRLDGKPIGDTAASWDPSVCPKCHYVLTGDMVLTQDRAKDLRAFLKTAAYQKAARTESSFFLLALIQQHLGTSANWIAMSYLRASWQREGTKSYRRYLQAALEKFEASLAGSPAEARENRLLIVEILRLQARFTLARARLLELLAAPEFSKPFYQALIQYELRLVAKRIASPKEVPRDLPSPPNPAKEAAQELFEHMAGYAEASAQWRLVDVHLGAINWYPYVLFGQLEGPGTYTVNRAWWFVDVDKEKALRDWPVFLAAHQKVEEAVARHRWLHEWRNAGKDRKIEAEIYNETTLTTGPGGAWEQAGLKGKATVELQLRGGSDARIFLGADDARALVTSSRGNPNGEHWLDRQNVFFFNGEKANEFLVIQPDGTFTQNVPKPPATIPEAPSTKAKPNRSNCE